MSTNDRYELIGGILYHTPVDDTTEQIQSANFVKAKEIGELILTLELKDVRTLVKNLGVKIRNYMNSPIVDFMYKHKKEYFRWICIASEEGQLNMIKYITEPQRSDINMDYNDALQMAARHGHIEIVKHLINIDVSIINYNYALRYASERGHLEVVKYLNGQKAITPMDRNTAFRCASFRGQLDVVKYLHERGADIHAIQESALRNACYYGHLEVVKYLVEAGADIHINNDTPLLNAFVMGYDEIVEYLIDNGANRQVIGIVED